MDTVISKLKTYLLALAGLAVAALGVVVAILRHQKAEMRSERDTARLNAANEKTQADVSTQAADAIAAVPTPKAPDIQHRNDFDSTR